MNTSHEFFEPLLSSNQEWFSPKEVAAIIGKSDQYVRDCFENQKILGHVLNGKAVRGQEKRHSYQIHRQSLLLFLLETANYEPSDFAKRVKKLLKFCHQQQLLEILDFLKNLLTTERKMV